MATKGVVVTAPGPTLDATARVLKISASRRKVLDSIRAEVVGASGRPSPSSRGASIRRAPKRAARKSGRRASAA